jgi:hypothetical protein
LSDSHYTRIGNNIVDVSTGEVVGQVDSRRGSPSGREEAGDTARKGLSACHNTRKSQKNGSVKLYVDGSLIKVTKNRTSINNNKQEVMRGKIRGFSKKSRYRLLNRLAMINKKDGFPLFITLTYPSEFPTDRKIYKADLEKFIKRLIYRFPKVSGFWRLEFQKRGAPHYHLLVWGLPYSDEIKKYISKTWFKVVGSGDEKHLKAGTQVARVRSWRGVMFYAGKYMAKMDNIEFETGRVWGYFNAGYIPWSRVEVIELSQKQVVKLMRLMRRYARIKARDFPSLTIFINDPHQWLRAINTI